jgi:hypothetical protein
MNIKNVNNVMSLNTRMGLFHMVFSVTLINCFIANLNMLLCQRRVYKDLMCLLDS